MLLWQPLTVWVGATEAELASYLMRRCLQLHMYVCIYLSWSTAVESKKIMLLARKPLQLTVDSTNLAFIDSSEMRHTFMQPQVFRRLELSSPSLWLVQSGIKYMLVRSVELTLLIVDKK